MRIKGMLAAGIFATAALAIPVSAVASTTAASQAPVTITAFAISPAAINYGARQVTVSGRLVEYNSPGTGVPNETVSIDNASTGAAVGTLETGSDGSFSAAVTLPGAAGYRAFFGGDATYGPGASATVHVSVNALPTAVTLNPQPASNVSAGTTLTFTGSVRIQLTDGTWEALPGAPVELVRNGDETVASGTTAADGTFSLPVAATGGVTWQADVPAEGSAGVAWYSGSDSAVDMVSVTHSTRIASFSVPATREAHQTFTVSGTAQAWNGSAWTSPAAVFVDFYYAFQGQTTWHLAGSAQVDTTGHFSARASVRPGHTIWQVRIAQQTSGDVYLGSSSGTANSFITDRTFSHVSHVGISGSRTIVSGWVRDWNATGQQTFGNIVGPYVKVYYHSRSTSTWSYLGEVRTAAGGNVTFTENKALHGYFRLVFPAFGNYLGSTSNTYYLA